MKIFSYKKTTGLFLAAVFLSAIMLLVPLAVPSALGASVHSYRYNALLPFQYVVNGGGSILSDGTAKGSGAISDAREGGLGGLSYLITSGSTDGTIASLVGTVTFSDRGFSGTITFVLDESAGTVTVNVAGKSAQYVGIVSIS